MNPIYLHGGGKDPAAFGAFTAAARGRVALIAVGDNAESYLPHYHALLKDVDELVGIFLKSGDTLTHERLAALEPAGVFVGGGTTSLYHNALCADRSWLDYVSELGIPCGGISAGAMIASERALIGGWQIETQGRRTQVVSQDISDNLDLVELRQGLGWVAFTVDVHASQFGTLTRLVNAVNSGMTDSGWAIDEDTMLIVEDDTIAVHGVGQAYQVRRSESSVKVTIHTAGSVTSV